ncbi:cytochrome b [Besnoitia besnoiti]|uniref:Cytochrome b n=1 Tax=Besnoitia besnoiti TaxID=94643 RepID=A0A2A9M0Y2_BESBE|nr:cytochrome b [Besnoitia besnoiti]PFH30894.1 cytochrome b [Besnoitia besnoiti]
MLCIKYSGIQRIFEKPTFVYKLYEYHDIHFGSRLLNVSLYVELSHPDNSIPVNRFITPLHIVPEWYFLAYYAVLKVIPSKTGGLLVFMSSLINLALLSEIRALNTRMLIRQHFMTRNVVSGWVIIWVYSMIFLIIIGSAIPQATYILYGRLATIVYLTTGLVLCLY